VLKNAKLYAKGSIGDPLSPLSFLLSPLSSLRSPLSVSPSACPYHNACIARDGEYALFIPSPLSRGHLTPLDKFAGLSVVALHDTQHAGGITRYAACRANIKSPVMSFFAAGWQDVVICFEK
jgi:hypothetical protein